METPRARLRALTVRIFANRCSRSFASSTLTSRRRQPSLAKQLIPLAQLARKWSGPNDYSWDLPDGDKLAVATNDALKAVAALAMKFHRIADPNPLRLSDRPTEGERRIRTNDRPLLASQIVAICYCSRICDSLVGMVMVMLLNARVQSWDSILLDKGEYALGFVVLGVIFSVVNLCMANRKHFRL